MRSRGKSKQSQHMRLFRVVFWLHFGMIILPILWYLNAFYRVRSIGILGYLLAMAFLGVFIILPSLLQVPGLLLRRLWALKVMCLTDVLAFCGGFLWLFHLGIRTPIYMLNSHEWNLYLVPFLFCLLCGVEALYIAVELRSCRHKQGQPL